MGLRLTRNDLATYAGLSRVGSDIKQGMKDWSMSEAANVTPSQEFSPEQAAELEAAAGVKDAEGNPLYQIKGNEGGTYSVTPTAGGETGTVAPGMQRMGGKTQATPFSQEQIEAQRYRNQADVATRFGDFREASALQGLAKGREEEGVTNQIRSDAMQGMKNTKDMRDEEKVFAMSKNMYESAIRMNRPDLAASYYNQMTQNRDALLARANERADRIYRTSGNIGGFIDSYNRYVADGMSIDSFKRNDDGSHTLWINTGEGGAREVTIPKERLSEYLLALRDPKRISEIETKRAEMLYKAQADAQEALNKPVAVGKDQTLVIPRTGQTFAPGANRGFDPKEANTVLDDARSILRDMYGYEKHPEIDPETGKRHKFAGQRIDISGTAKPTWTNEAISKANLAERVFMKNPGIPPAMLANIADKGVLSATPLRNRETGEVKSVPSIDFGGRSFLLGGAEDGQEAPAIEKAPAPTNTTTTGLGTRDARGKIGGGMQKIGPQSSATPQDFPRVSSSDQASRDINAGHILVAEAGGLEGAKRDLAMLDAELSRRGLDGTQRGILQSQRNRLAAGIAAVSQQG